MSTLTKLDIIREQGELLADVLDEHERRLGEFHDVRMQFASYFRERVTEKKIADDRFEFICRRFDELQALLTTNGSGGEHG